MIKGSGTIGGKPQMRSRYSSEATGAVDRFGCRWRRDDDASPWFVTEDDVRIEIPKSWGEVMTRPRMTMGALILLRGPLRLAWNPEPAASCAGSVPADLDEGVSRRSEA